MTSQELLEAQYDILGQEGKGFAEIRTFEEGTPAKTFFCKDKAEFVRIGLQKIASKEQAYVGINPRTRTSGTINDIDVLTTTVVDIDPVRPKNTGSTPEQLESAIALGTRLRDEQGGGIIVSSGSGCHVYLPIVPIPITDRNLLSDSLRKWNHAIKEHYGTKELKIDHIWDLPRVIRLWGSYNARSQRYCGPISESDLKKPRLSLNFSQTPEVKATVVKAVDETTAKFSRLVKANKYLKELVDGSIAFESNSEADFAFIATLGKANFNEEEITNLWEYNKQGNKEPKKGDIKRVLKDKIERDTKAFSLGSGSSSYFETLKHRRMGIRTGFRTLDEMISGLKDGKFIIIGARPGTGKTTLVTQILTNIAEQGIPCLFFPTEVGAEPIVDKILARKCEIQLKKFQNGTFNEQDVSKIQEMRPYIQSLPLTIYEDFGLNVEKYEQVIDRYAPKVVCLDYFQALKWEDSSRLGEKEDAVRRIKKITKDRDITTICLSQLNRGTQDKGGKASLAELKGTAVLEELGDVIAQMYQSPELIQHPKIVDLVVTKSKYSATGNIVLKFDVGLGMFKEDDINEQHTA